MALLMEIETRGPRAFDSLVESLIEANQEHLAQELGYPSSGSSLQATTACVNRPDLFGQPTKSVPQVRPARDGTGDYSSTPMDALGYSSTPMDALGYSSTSMDALGYSSTPMGALGSYPRPMVDSGHVHEYRMKSIPRGRAVIINNKNFNTMLKLGQKLKDRQGTDVDRDKLQNLFMQLQFQVVVHNDCTGMKIKEIVENLRSYNHSMYDCFIIAILSHGDEGAIYGTDGDLVTLVDIMDQFGANRCPTLSGKPKLFFVQACRGEKYDYGVQVNAVDGANNSAPTRKMPCQSDMFLAYSTVPGYVSWRNAGGSWFVQALTDVIPPLARSMDLGTMMTRVNYKISQDFESNCKGRYKQISAPTNMLTKDLYFFSKQGREYFT